ncbi:MAG: hypothetical protein J7K36_05555 [Archaeoglobaceae archaeon]|nr:hypothetical protein [Archaeoglobaceae archaeon]
MIDLMLRLYQKANEKNWKPWELQDELRKICNRVVAVGDDLSFVIKFDYPITLSLDELIKMKGKKAEIYPYKNAVRFDKGYIAFDGKFLRISRELDKEKLIKILKLLNLPED